MLESVLDIVNLVRWEWFRLRRRAGFLVLAILTLLVPGLLMVVAVVQNLTKLVPGLISDEPLKFGYFDLAAGGLAVVTPVVAILLAALLHATDLQGGNCRTLAARGAARRNILAAKACTAALLLLAYHLIAYLLAGLPAAVLAPHFAGWDAGATDMAASFVNGLLYLSLGIVLSHWRESTAFTVGVGIAFIAFEAIAYPIAGAVGQAVGWPVSEVTTWTIWGVANGLQGESEEIARAWYIPIVAGYAVALAAAALGLFHKYDLRASGE